MERMTLPRIEAQPATSNSPRPSIPFQSSPVPASSAFAPRDHLARPVRAPPQIQPPQHNEAALPARVLARRSADALCQDAASDPLVDPGMRRPGSHGGENNSADPKHKYRVLSRNKARVEFGLRPRRRLKAIPADVARIASPSRRSQRHKHSSPASRREHPATPRSLRQRTNMRLPIRMPRCG